MPNEGFWVAVDRLVVAGDAGEDVAALAERLLESYPSLGPQLQEAISSLDSAALAKAAQLSDGMRGVSEDVTIALGCAVIAAGPVVFAEAVRDPDSLVRPWDLSRGDLLLAFNPGVALVSREPTDRREPHTIDVAIGDSRFGWPGWLTDAVAHHQCRRQEKDERWRAIFARHAAEHLIIGLDAARGLPNKVGTCRSPRAGYLVVPVTWDTPRSPLGLPGFFRNLLDSVAASLED